MFIGNALFITLSGYYLIYCNPSKANRRRFCIIATICWVALSGLRAASIGADTAGYMNGYENMGNVSWEALFLRFRSILFLGAEGKDPGYNIVAKLVYTVSPNYQVFLLVIAALFHIPLGILIYKKSSDPLLSWVLYSCLFYSFFAITGNRQTIATAMVVLLGYRLIEKRNLILFLIIVALAYTIHASVIIFLPFFFLYRLRVGRKGIVLSLLLFPVVYINRVRILSVLSAFIGYEQYEEYGTTGPITFTFVYFVVMMVLLIGYGAITKNDEKAKLISPWINAICVAFDFIPLAFVNPSAMRGIQYYSIFLIFLLPDLMNAFDKKSQRIARLGCILLLVFLLIRNNPSYCFFWQDW